MIADRAEVMARVVEDILLGKRVSTEHHSRLVAYLREQFNKLAQDVIREIRDAAK